MPCVLNYATKEEEDKIIKKPSYPLILRLLQSATQDYVPLPPAFSPTLIVLLLSSGSFSIDHDKKQYRNIFVLRRSGNKGIVTIIERRVQLEVYYEFTGFNNREWYNIRSNVHEQIREAVKTLGFDENSIDIEYSFPCSCSPPMPDFRHIPCEPALDHCEADCGPQRAMCEKNKDVACRLKKKELRWLSRGILLERKMNVMCLILYYRHKCRH